MKSIIRMTHGVFILTDGQWPVFIPYDNPSDVIIQIHGPSESWVKESGAPRINTPSPITIKTKESNINIP